MQKKIREEIEWVEKNGMFFYNTHYMEQKI
jgi:hypothetical protein